MSGERACSLSVVSFPSAPMASAKLGLQPGARKPRTQCRSVWKTGTRPPELALHPRVCVSRELGGGAGPWQKPVRDTGVYRDLSRSARQPSAVI